ncbi:MFS transporter [Microlunatus soli]|uniref:Major Facilitator Superfamily protein n=1 Tax=Microlunatus soli TaxID=630515 RepID=A0A1H2AI57_9ACTN|nr:MFS transporter [Microlunatus soli]SDT45648.1 Major Facilitator Superfamily protein [Microlunatus soli]
MSAEPNPKDAISESLTVDRSTLRRASIAGMVGTTLENYDFVIYGTAAALVFNELFFPNLNPAIGVLASFATYGVGFVARPLGGLFFSHFGDRIGRKWVLVATLFLMGTATFVIGLLPTYGSVGVLAPVLLTLCRLLQGFGAGAEQAGGIVLLTESAPQNKRGRYASLVYVGAALGSVLGALVWVLVQLMPDDRVQSIGWRLVFLSSVLVTIAAYIFRRRLRESPVFEEAKSRGKIVERQKTPIGVAFRFGWRGIGRVFLLNIGAIAHSYFYQVFVANYIKNDLNMPGDVVPPMLLIGGVFAMGAAVSAGVLSDRFGRRPIYIVICAVLMLMPYPAFLLLHTQNVIIIGIVVVLGFIFAVEGTVGVQSAFLPELFGSRYRYAGVALGRETSAAVGGFGPFIAQGLLAATGSFVPVVIYLMVLIGIGLVTAIYAPETRGRDLLSEHDARHGDPAPTSH